MNPLVSIIIPCFNAERTIGEAIESVVSQSYKNLEVIVVDDGSTDGSLQVVKSFGDRLKWKSGVNQGACCARNVGIEMARGELVQFLDADDLLDPMRLERLVPLARQHGSGCLVASGWTSIREDGVSDSCHFLDINGDDPFIWAIHNQLPTPCSLYWRDVLLSLGGFTIGLSSCQEFDLHLRLFKANLKLYPIRESLVTVRRQPGSISSNFVRICMNRIKVQSRILEELPIEETDRRFQILVSIALDARKLVRHGKFEEAREAFGIVRKASPKAMRCSFGRFVSRLLLFCVGPIVAEILLQRAATLTRLVR